EALAEVARARLARRFGAVSLVDVGDVVGTGSSGGSTHILSALLEDGHGLRALVPLHDPAAVETAWAAGQGSRVSLELRGTPGLPPQPVVRLRARVALIRETAFGRTALLEAGHLRIALAERPPLTLHPKMWRELGVEPRRADAIVQKSFFHYRMFYALVSPRHLPVATPGPSSLENLRGLRLGVPSFPIEDPPDWRDGDLLLRNLD
ncbi:MAG: MlrC C-terminal domain-containing protein, partial [Polyangia bacterium]|nr:MlrC C-terminal domain-containing protein [Polyangia bacterium]